METLMQNRLSKGLDPLTGEKLATKGVISMKSGVPRDETGRECTLSAKGTWIYKEN
jgi:hypothetical protein